MKEHIGFDTKYFIEATDSRFWCKNEPQAAFKNGNLQKKKNFIQYELLAI